jgi:eukaryotic-like serine/threonine-protein kinase
MASPTASGSLIADRYRVMERLGSGGMAVVYLAEDERLGRRVAVKRLHTGSPEDTAKRFGREARLGASLNHPNVATVYDTVTDEGSVVIVMEYVEGESLADTIRRGPVDPAEAVRILRGVAGALDHAHGHGIVHRDVKPANILLGRNGDVKLVDLGIATAVEGTRITHSGSVMGTAAYMAPEQLDGSDAGPATDTYALAAVAYEMLTGRPAYRGTTPVEIAHQVVKGPPPELDEAWPQAPQAACDAVRHGLAFHAGDRPESACAFVEELSAGLAPEPEAEPEPEPTPTAAMPRTSVERPPAPAPPPPVHREPAARPEPPRREPSPRPVATRPRSGRSPLVPLLALLALAVVGGVLALTLLGGGDDGQGDGSSSSSAAEKQQRAERRRARRQRAARQREQAQSQQQPATPAPAPDSGGSSTSSSYEIPQPSGDSVAEGSRLQLQGDQMVDSDPEGAVKVLERSVKAFPAGTDDIHLQYAYFSLGKALRLSGRPEDAIPVLELRLKNPDQRSTVKAELERARSQAAG